MPTMVHVRDNESFEQALRRFKRKCEKAGILSEIKKRQHYEKPSVRRKRKLDPGAQEAPPQAGPAAQGGVALAPPGSP